MCVSIVSVLDDVPAKDEFCPSSAFTFDPALGISDVSTVASNGSAFLTRGLLESSVDLFLFTGQAIKDPAPGHLLVAQSGGVVFGFDDLDGLNLPRLVALDVEAIDAPPLGDL